MFGFSTSSFFHVWDFLCDVKHMWPINHCEKHGPNHHFSSKMTATQLSFHSPCLSREDRDPEWDLEDGWWHDDGDGRWKLECPVDRQAAERSDAIRARRCLLLFSSSPQSEYCTQQLVYVKDKQWHRGCNPLAGQAGAVWITRDQL